MLIKACVDEVDKVAREVIKILPRNVVLLLNGDLASGKTTLVKSIVKLKGIKYDVTSPISLYKYL